jgi:hypothetical protein
MMENVRRDAPRIAPLVLAWRRYSVLALYGSVHHQIDSAVLKAFPCQTIPRHLLDLAKTIRNGLRATFRATAN